MSSKEYKKVLNFWFGLKSDKDYLQMKSFWYGSSPSDDQLVDKHLGQYYRQARDGQLDDWIDLGGGEGALALVLLLDQVPRNIFRNKAEAYMTDSKALIIAKHAVNKGWDRDMNNVFKRYMYSPFNHSECFEDQKISIKLFTQLGDPSHIYWAQKYHDLIKEFGRFPHRDEVLGRHN